MPKLAGAHLFPITELHETGPAGLARNPASDQGRSRTAALAVREVVATLRPWEYVNEGNKRQPVNPRGRLLRSDRVRCGTDICLQPRAFPVRAGAGRRVRLGCRAA